jgi:HEAT repeat protein
MFPKICYPIIVLVLAAQSAVAQVPRIVNGALTRRPVAGTLQRDVDALVASETKVAWIGYAVPIVGGERFMCCVSGDDRLGCCARCGLESQAGVMTSASPVPAGGPVKLEGGGSLVVMLRVENRAIVRLRVFSDDCELDAGGLNVTWLDGVTPPDSVSFLRAHVIANAKGPTKASESAISAIALHNDPSADRALDQLLDAGVPEEVRRKVTFWLGSARGRAGLDRLRRVLQDDPSERVRESATFGLSVSREADALPALIAAARSDPSSRVRGQALFWLAQKAGNRAAETITSAIENDPETEVKKKAVFALSQLPKDEGIPLMIQVARTNRNPAVRKQAIFWLGQSNDPRALKFFEDILVKP